MKAWSWMVGVALGLAVVQLVGCGGDDSSSSSAADATAGGGSSASSTGAASSATSTTPAITSPQTLKDVSISADGGSGFGFFSDAAPAAGSVQVTTSWTAVTWPGGVFTDIPLTVIVNEDGGAGTGFTANNVTSPDSGAINMDGPYRVKVQVQNNMPNTRATVHVTVVWTSF